MENGRDGRVGRTWKWGAQLDVIGVVQAVTSKVFILYGLLKIRTCTYIIRHLHPPTEKLFYI